MCVRCPSIWKSLDSYSFQLSHIYNKRYSWYVLPPSPSSSSPPPSVSVVIEDGTVSFTFQYQMVPNRTWVWVLWVESEGRGWWESNAFNMFVLFSLHYILLFYITYHLPFFLSDTAQQPTTLCFVPWVLHSRLQLYSTSETPNKNNIRAAMRVLTQYVTVWNMEYECRSWRVGVVRSNEMGKCRWSGKR